VAICAAAGWNPALTRGQRAPRRTALWVTTAIVLAIGALALRMEVRAGRIVLADARLVTAALVVPLVLAGVALLAAISPRGPMRRRLAGIAATALLLGAVAQFGAMVRPMSLRAPQRTLLTILAWLDEHGYSDRPIFSASPWLAYFRDFAELPRIRKSRRLVASMLPGTIVLWDRVYCPSDYHRLPLQFFADDPAYKRLEEFRRGAATEGPVDVVVFEKIHSTPVPASEPEPYPPDIVAPAEPNGRYYVESETNG
jgi:hypothetical protein